MSKFDKAKVMKAFLEDMERAPARALYSSFRRYATLRDELIEKYVEVTGVDAKEFYNEIALKNAREMGVI